MKTSKFYPLILFLFFTAVSIGQTDQLPDLSSLERKPVLDETFDSNSRGWLTDNQYLSGNASNGSYIIKCKNFQGQSGLTAVQVNVDHSKDLEIEASVKIINGSGGLVFGMNNNYYHYRIEINNSGDIYVAKQSNKLDKIYTSLKNPAIRSGGENKIVLVKSGNLYYLFINETFIKEFKGIKPEGTHIGFNVGVKSEIEAAYLNVCYLERKTEPHVAEKNVSQTDQKKETGVEQKPPVQAAVILPAVLPSGPPEIIWTSPSTERVDINEYTAHAKASVKSASKLTQVRFYVNDVAVGESEFQVMRGDSGRYLIDKIVNLKPGENSVYFLATNEKGESTRSSMRYFVNPESTPPVLGWVLPAESSSVVNTEVVSIEGIIKSASGVNSTSILVNGFPQSEENRFQQGINREIKVKKSIVLREGENSIYLIAANSAGRIQSEKRTIIYNKALSEKRLALVIGNSNYSNGVSLKNPVNDANLIEGTLKQLGFDVIKSLNVDKATMENSIREFSRQMSNYNVALFYYAGHGIQVDGINYLIPIDAKLENKNECSWEAVAVNRVTDEFGKHETNTNIVILDACRNNPFRSWVRGPEQGFKSMSPINGTIISYATSEGATAADGTGANGLFTEELVKQMVVPQTVESVFKATRKNVMERSNKQQVPVEWNYLIGDFYFKR
ncbi:MAG: caspase family protein [Bacteroidia bacterium]|nr:caspase family protein [Bacteroidia bacterium]